MRVEWTTPATDDFEFAQEYYESVNPTTARQLARRVAEATMMLSEHPLAGRPGLRQQTREWVVQRSPYLLVYRIADDAVQILHVWCAGQDWTQRED